MKKYDVIYHLSHNDLDGYGSQYMTHFLPTLTNTKINYFNTNYDQVLENINKICSLIFNENKKLKEKLSKNLEKNIIIETKKPTILFLITDLSINSDFAKKLNNFKRGNKDILLDIQVLDHHKSNEEVSKQNEWYKYDLYKCGASLTSEFVNTLHNNENIKRHLLFAGKFIQAHDIWEKESPYFGFANLLSDLVFNLYFSEFLLNEKREFIFSYIFNYLKVYQELEFNLSLYNENITVEDMENKLSLILKKSLLLKAKDTTIIEDKNTRSLYKLFYYQSELYSKIKDNFETLKIKNFNCKVFYNENSTFYQYFSHYLLETNDDIDFCINIKDSGICSFRSVKENVDVSIIASLLSDIPNQGGGHKNAAGCKINFNSKVHSYDELIKEINKKIHKKGL